jgi:hypothetical protein
MEEKALIFLTNRTAHFKPQGDAIALNYRVSQQHLTVRAMEVAGSLFKIFCLLPKI